MCDSCVIVRHEGISDLSFSHHVFIRLQVESEGFPHFSNSIKEDLHLHHMLLIPLFEFNVWTHTHKETADIYRKQLG